MMTKDTAIKCDLAIIGCGLSGMAAAFFATEKGFSTVQAGVSGGLIFATGLLDVMGTHPIETAHGWTDPWAAIDAVSKDIPNHPYARLTPSIIKESLGQVVSFLGKNDLSYVKSGNHNSELMTQFGTTKTSYYIPETMWEGVLALKEKRPCLIVGFEELKDFSATRVTRGLRDRWPGLRPLNISLKGMAKASSLVSGDILARDMETTQTMEKLVHLIGPHVKDAETVGLPAVLGMRRPRKIIETLSLELGAKVFEIPTTPLSVPGLRLNEVFTQGLAERGVKQFFPERILSWERGNDGSILLAMGQGPRKKWIRAKGVILATGRFWAHGLRADRDKIREPLFDLPVHQPEKRDEWHREDFLDLRGHPANRAGLTIDNQFRPLNGAGEPAFEKLFAVGSILAHQDWMRMKCGSGLAISSAYAAVKAFSNMRG
ncbi:MAG: anaerobic glycerol-3-phosphate dehydrogenase subunit B [Deltaproteobacteria bacterium]|nr:anaerobic glycerol-3-phosphate dehydrogenase subunit B [Deltaproteobacteria bacterium]